MTYGYLLVEVPRWHWPFWPLAPGMMELEVLDALNQSHNPIKTRKMLLTLACQVLIDVVSALTAVFSEQFYV